MITDYLDGALARRNNLVTMAGKWIDPLSDCIFFLFVYLAFYSVSLLPLVLLILFLLRELLMYTVVRPLYIRNRMDPAAKLPGKLKTVLQIVGSCIVTVIMIGYRIDILSFPTTRIITIPLLSIMVATSLASMYWYVRPLLGPEGGRHRGVDDAGIRPPEGKHPSGGERRNQLYKLILPSVIPLMILYSAYTWVVTVLYHLNMQTYGLYAVLNGVYHGLIVLGSLIVGREFRLEGSEDILSRINLPLFLSFSRICAVPTLVYLFLFVESINPFAFLIPLLAYLFLTDLFDGLLARTLDQTTRIGRILDAAGDYVLIVAIAWVYRIIGFIPIWLFLIVLVRLVVQTVGIVTLYTLRGYSYLELSFLGKASVFSVFTVFGFELLEYLQVPGLGHHIVVMILEIITAAVVVASLIEKLIFLWRSFSKALREIS
jgi:CDP-diacylglycerol--glycerol-3-phosphate 3-phosphatidyltransferase